MLWIPLSKNRRYEYYYIKLQMFERTAHIHGKITE